MSDRLNPRFGATKGYSFFLTVSYLSILMFKRKLFCPAVHIQSLSKYFIKSSRPHVEEHYSKFDDGTD